MGPNPQGRVKEGFRGQQSGRDNVSGRGDVAVGTSLAGSTVRSAESSDAKQGSSRPDAPDRLLRFIGQKGGAARNREDATGF